jgi:hypothetical protein
MNLNMEMWLLRGLQFVSQMMEMNFFFAVLGFELRAYILSHSTSPFVCVCVYDGFFRGRVLQTVCLICL